MINKKTLMIVGGSIAAYLIWKKFFKEGTEDLVKTAESDVEEMANAEGVLLGKLGEQCFCEAPNGDAYKCPCPKSPTKKLFTSKRRTIS